MGGSHESPFKMAGFPTISGTSPAKQKATISSVADSLQNLPNPAAEKAYQKYLKETKAVSDSTSAANQKVLQERAKQIQQNVSPKEFEKQVKDFKKDK
jgi:hypothetical protein